MKVRRRQPALEAWQYKGWITGAPLWVARRIRFNHAGELVVDRQSGSQVVDQGDWLVRDLDGAPHHYDCISFNETFEQV